MFCIYLQLFKFTYITQKEDQLVLLRRKMVYVNFVSSSWVASQGQTKQQKTFLQSIAKLLL